MSWSPIRTWALSSGAANSVALGATVSPASFRVRRPELSVCPWPNCTQDHGTISLGVAPTGPPPCLVPPLRGLHVWDGVVMLMILLRFPVSRLGFASAKSKFGGFVTLVIGLLGLSLTKDFLFGNLHPLDFSGAHQTFRLALSALCH